VSSNPVLLLFIAPIGGGVVFAVVGFLGSGRLGRFSIEEAAIGGGFGVVAGLASILYVLPLLTWTDIRKSVPFAYGGALAVAIMASLLVKSIPLPALVFVVPSHLLLCIASAFLFRRTERRAMECPQCRYALRGVRLVRCPECGAELTSWVRRLTK
jgi:hypothetical protein